MDNYGPQGNAKMSGCLEKKGKMRMMSTWKKYWFVLEGRLLLYYRSKDEYEAISPCKGSINLGPPCTVKSCPSVVCVFQIQTRTNTITLRAENANEQKKWMQAIMSALNQNQNNNSESTTRLNHFRYSLDDLVPKVEPCDNEKLSKKLLERQNTMPNRLKLAQKSSNEIIQRLQKIGAQTYGGSLGAITKVANRNSDTDDLLKNEKTTSQCILSNERIVDHKSSSDENFVAIRRSNSNLRLSKEYIYERVSGDSNVSRCSNRVKSLVVDNDNYSVPMKKRHSLCEMNGGRSTDSILVENDAYCTTDKIKMHQSEDVIYAEPKVAEATDLNKNSVFFENNSYYAVSDVSGKSFENEYEDLDKYVSHYSTPKVQSKEGTGENSSQSSQECEVKTKKKFMDLAVFNSKNEKKRNKDKVKKSQSFIKRVWRKKNKKRDKKEEEEDIYTEVDHLAVEKVELTDGNAVQMLFELQNVLEHMRPMLKKSISYQSEKEEQLEKSSDEVPAPRPITEPICPSLPPKHPKTQNVSLYTEITKNNHLINQNEPVRSIDEILEDLSKEKVEQKTKVKLLIEKFSEPENEEEVILRKHSRHERNPTRHSDELTKLLNELAKVTNAPIMTPGVTSSLMNPNLTDEEWLKLLPIRQRRLSEPDYDIPRPHRSIHLLPKKDQSDAIPATRFFGPVLPSATTQNSNHDESLGISMTPDSLEVEDNQRSPSFSYTSHNYHECPHLENELAKDLKCFSHNYKREEDNIIYAMPKPYMAVATHIVNTCHNICGGDFLDEHTIIYKNVKNIDISADEVFNDSLELCNETSTEF